MLAINFVRFYDRETQTRGFWFWWGFELTHSPYKYLACGGVKNYKICLEIFYDSISKWSNWRSTSSFMKNLYKKVLRKQKRIWKSDWRNLQLLLKKTLNSFSCIQAWQCSTAEMFNRRKRKTLKEENSEVRKDKRTKSRTGIQNKWKFEIKIETKIFMLLLPLMSTMWVFIYLHIFFSGRRNEFIFKAMMTFLCQESRFLWMKRKILFDNQVLCSKWLENFDLYFLFEGFVEKRSFGVD